jgi:hypothetical protein
MRTGLLVAAGVLQALTANDKARDAGIGPYPDRSVSKQLSDIGYPCF